MRARRQAARRSGVAIETIRWYERVGLVPTARRAANGRRYYGDDEVTRLRFVARCRGLGLSRRDIAALLELSEASGGSCAAVNAIGERHLADVRAKLPDLQAIEAALADLFDRCDDTHAACPAFGVRFD